VLLVVVAPICVELVVTVEEVVGGAVIDVELVEVVVEPPGCVELVVVVAPG
jgi:hypothetical protein